MEITGKCQLACVHCYADSGPAASHGSMTCADWLRVLDEAAELDVGMVQFIGGEPTLHPDLATLVEHAVARGLAVEVFSNLVHVTPRLWETFGQPGVRLACSYYSDDASQHAAVTGRTGSHPRTRANIAEAVRRSIPLRVGVVNLGDGQRAEQAMAELTDLGVAEVGYDRLRQVGRGIRTEWASMDQVCGHCASGVPKMCDPQCGPNCGPACMPQGTRHPCGPRGGCRPNYEHATASTGALDSTW
ncbi:MAG: radical SAM protein [Pseudonocardiaceae bacterium]|nr:radical SAM protein [Pseudonocardiaceae bacterium]